MALKLREVIGECTVTVTGFMSRAALEKRAEYNQQDGLVLEYS